MAFQRSIPSKIVPSGGVDLSRYATKADLATKVNKETNKSLVENELIEKLRNLENYDDTEIRELIEEMIAREKHTHANKSVLDRITASKIAEWDSKSTFSGDYNDLINKPDLSNLENYASKSWVNQRLIDEIPTKVSELRNDENYIKKSELDPLNTQLTYAKKQWVLDQINNIGTFQPIVVDALPTEAEVGAGRIDKTKMYLVLVPGALVDTYEKWINTDGTDNGWQNMGTSSMDFTQYYKKTEIDQMFNTKVRAEVIPVADRNNEFIGSDVESVLMELNRKIQDVDLTKYAEIVDLADVAFSGLYDDLIDLPIPRLKGTISDPIIISDVSNGIYFFDGFQRVLVNSAETTASLCYGVTAVSSYVIGDYKTTVLDTLALEGGQFRKCKIYCTYPMTLTGVPNVVYKYYVTDDEVLTKTNTVEYIPTENYHPATKKYVDDLAFGDADIDLSNYLAKDNATAYTPTAPHNPATKKYVDETIPKNVSELVNDVPYLVQADLDTYATEEWTVMTVKTEIANSGKLERVIIDALPDVALAEDDKIYMLKQGTDTDTYYDEYMLMGDELVKTGSSRIDLSNYYNKAETDTEISEASIIDFVEGGDYNGGQFVLRENVIYRAKADMTNVVDWVEDNWTPISSAGTDLEEVERLIQEYLFNENADTGEPDLNDHIYVQHAEIQPYTIDDIKEWIGLTDEELNIFRGFIDDTVTQTDKVWSSSKTYSEIFNAFQTYLNDTIVTDNKTWSSSKISAELQALKDYFDNFDEPKPIEKANGSFELTRDQVQTIVVQEVSTATVILPEVSGAMEIHLIFDGAAGATLTYNAVNGLPVRWNDGEQPTIEDGYCYEIIFSYINSTIGWLAGYMQYYS